METIWNLVPLLSREPLEVDKTCKLKECAPRCKEPTFLREFHSNMPGSRFILADITEHVCLLETLWNIVPQLSREPLEVYQK